MKTQSVPSNKKIVELAHQLSPELMVHFLQKKHRHYSGYYPWEFVASGLAITLGTAHRMPWEEMDFASRSASELAWFFEREEFPVYYLERNLFEAFQLSDLPSAIYAMRRVVPRGILVLPSRSGLQTPDNTTLGWLAFHHILAGDCFGSIRFGDDVINYLKPAEVNKLMWMSLIRGATYVSTMELTPDQDGLPRSGKIEMSPTAGYYDRNTDPDTEQGFLRTVDAIALQTILYLQTYPEDLETASGKKLARKPAQAKGSRKFEPLWIGRDYIRSMPAQAKGGHHASPRSHWRRGHWRRVATGEGRKDREWRWIQPCLIKGGSGE